MSDLIDRQAAINAIAEIVTSMSVCTSVDECHGMKRMQGKAVRALADLPSAQQWIPCSERLPEEYGEYQITWTTSYAPPKRFIGDSEYEVTSVWDEERNTFKGEWLLDAYIQAYPDVKVIAWMPLPEPYRIPQSETE